MAVNVSLNIILVGASLVFLMTSTKSVCQNKENNNPNELFLMPENIQSRCVNFENPLGTKGEGGKENMGAKGHSFERMEPGEKKILFDIQGCGIINHIWITISNRDPKTLRSLKIEMFWENSSTPAVQAPLGDFFCNILGKTTSFENELFSNPEGRSFNCYVPMPFKRSAKIVITNESGKAVANIFYDINFIFTDFQDEEVLYFHAYWNRVSETKLEEDFTILPRINGRGRYLGSHIGVITNPIYKDFWWGEGESKIYLDGDIKYPTLVGTGTEDYPGTGWGIGIFNNRYQGCLLADAQKGYYGIYRYHIPDPIFFYKDLKVTMQQIGGGSKKQVIAAMDTGVPLKPISIATDKNFIKLLEMKPIPNLKDTTLPNGWTNFYRSDDWSAVAFFYFNSPENGLPKIGDINIRTEGIIE